MLNIIASMFLGVAIGLMNSGLGIWACAGALTVSLMGFGTYLLVLKKLQNDLRQAREEFRVLQQDYGDALLQNEQLKQRINHASFILHGFY